MKAETTAWRSDAAAGSRDAVSSERVRFWQPAPGQPLEFSCASLNGGSAALHVHEEWQFAVAAEPSMLTLGAFRRYRAHAHELTVVQPYEVHTEGGLSGEPRRWLVLHVGTSVMERVYQGSSSIPRFASPVVRDPHSSRRLADLLQGSIEGRIEGSDFTDRVLEWLLHLLRSHAVVVATAPSTGTNGGPVERARAYLQAHATEPLPLADLVNVAGVTTSHLVRAFSRSVGLPPRSYHTQIRLARARRLLVEGRPATWVAYECGFADQSHLSRRFKEFYGMTPGTFQAAVRESPASPSASREAA